MDTLAFLTQQLENKGVSIQRLRALIFGSSIEKTRDVFADDKQDKPENDSANGDTNNGTEQKDNSAQQGENLATVLSKRAKELTAPIQMCDMLSRNSPKDFQTILAGCNAHARRRYVEFANSFLEPVRHVLEQFKIIYENDAITKSENMNKERRLTFDQNHSAV